MCVISACSEVVYMENGKFSSRKDNRLVARLELRVGHSRAGRAAVDTRNA